MLRYSIRRVGQLIPVLFGVTIVVFLIIHAIPGNPAQVILGQQANASTIRTFSEQLGLDKPLYMQYLMYLNHMIHGNLGTSLVTQRPIIQEIGPHLAATAELAICSMFFAVVVGVNAGILSAWKRNTWFDYAAMVIALIGVSMPIFWLGLVLQWIFGVHFQWLPVIGQDNPRDPIHVVTNFYLIDALIGANMQQFWDVVRHLILPSIALGTIPMAIIARMTRASMLEVLKHDYVRTARAKGMNEFWVVYKHALKNSFAPVLTVIGLQLGALLGGAVLTETIFGWPGVGLYLYNAIGARDYPVIQSGILVLATIFIIVNLIVDLLYTYLDPRIQYK